MTAGSPDPEIPASSSSSSWSREQDKAFEDALVLYYESQSEDKWEKIAEAVPGKDVAEVKQHYEILIEDIKCIESGLVPLPSYISSDDSTSSRKKGAHSSNSGGPDAAIPATKSGSKADQERRKGVAWTEEEHRLFLLGLDKFGKGDWRSISRNFVISRTPTQVASHAQKYFIRLNSANKDRRRSSIHDITTVNNGETSGAQGPITGQGNNVTGSGLTTTTAATTTTKPGKNAVQPVVSSYGTAIGQPVAGPSGASAVGTPVMIPPPYVARPAFPSQVVTATPMNVVPVAYPVSQPTIQQ